LHARHHNGLAAHPQGLAAAPALSACSLHLQNYLCRFTITVTNENNGAALANAAVTATYTVNSVAGSPGTLTTGSGGTVTFNSKALPTATGVCTLTINSLTRADSILDSGAVMTGSLNY